MRQRGNTTITVLILLGLGIFVLGIVGIWALSTVRNEVKLRNEVMAEQNVCKTNLDKMWKTISQQAQVADQYKDSFIQVMTETAKLRYEDQERVLFSWIQEHNPTLSEAVFMKVMDTITSERTSFTNHQEILINKNLQHTNLVTTPPESMLLTFLGKEPIEIKLITSEKTEQMYRDGQENDIELFPDKSPEKEQ